MKLRSGSDGPIVWDATRKRWVSLRAALERHAQPGLDAEGSVLDLLCGGAPVRDAVAQLLEAVRDDAEVAADPRSAGVPIVPRSMRAFMVWDKHYVAAGRAMVRRFFPKPIATVVGGFERVTGRTFPMLKPKPSFFETPAFYVANHTAVLADGQDMWWPSHTAYLDFELELACVLARPLADATPDEAAEAIGGWFVLNDWSARDIQAKDARTNVFGPVVKSKTFANSIGSDVITPDELPDWQRATGRVRVDGEVWCEGTTAGAVHDIGAMLAHASAGEVLAAGDVFSTGTMPGCCGLELDRWIKPGQAVELEIDGIGTLTNRVRADATPTTAFPARALTTKEIR